MAVLSLEAFFDAIVASRLMERQRLAQRLREFHEDPHSTDRSAKNFARLLVTRGDLTVYQAERLLAGRTEGFFLGDFKILDRLGAGGMGKVYLAEQLKLGRQVALKTLTHQHADDQEYVARFHREARAAAQLKHPNIVQVYDVGQQGRIHYIVMELVQGKNVKQLLKERGPFRTEQALEIVEQAARGLAHAHQHGIVHRDIKPSNLVLEGQTVKILDLGLARRSDAGETMTQEGHGVGTPDYMSPEQFQDARRVDGRSDIYSLGCTWYALLAGRPPFAEADPLGKALAHQTRPPEPIESLVPALPPWIARIIHKMLAKSPDERYPSCQELLSDIERHRSARQAARLAATVTWASPGAGGGAGASTKEADSRSPLEAAQPTEADTLIARPSTSVPVVLLYLLPVMAALVLGGLYFGVRLLREQLPEAEPVVVEVSVPARAAAQPSPDGKPPDKGKEGAGESATSTGGGPARDVSLKPREKTAQVAAKEPAPAPEETPGAKGPASTSAKTPAAKKPEAVVWRVGAAEGMVPDLASAWDESADGDSIQLTQTVPIRVGPLEANHKRLRLIAAVKSGLRPIVLFEPPDEPQAGRGLWRIADGGLEAEGIDFYVDVSNRRAADTELVLFELIESDLRLVDSSITVVNGTLEGRPPVTAVKCCGERPWDANARGDPPRALEVELRNSMVRGPWTTVYVQSRQTVIRIENSIVCSPRTLVHAFHTRPLEFAHQRLGLEVGGCTLDLGGPLVLVNARPYDLAATPLSVTMRATILASSSGVARPAQILWESPTSTERLSAVVRWIGAGNCYCLRGEGLQAKSPAGPVVTLVESPADWQRLGLGEETGSMAPSSFKILTGPWHKRSTSDYSLYAAQARAAARGLVGQAAQLGADIKRVAEPRRLPRR